MTCIMYGLAFVNVLLMSISVCKTSTYTNVYISKQKFMLNFLDNVECGLFERASVIKSIRLDFF